MINFGLIKSLFHSCGGPKPPNSMISGLLSPGEPSFMDFTNNTSKHIRQCGNIFETYYLYKYQIREKHFLNSLDQILKTQAPTNDEDSSQKCSKIFDMRSVSSKKHEMEIWQIF